MTKRYIKGSVCDEIVDWLHFEVGAQAEFRGGIQVAKKEGLAVRVVEVDIFLLVQRIVGPAPILCARLGLDGRTYYADTRRLIEGALLAADKEIDRENGWDQLPVAMEDI